MLLHFLVACSTLGLHVKANLKHRKLENSNISELIFSLKEIYCSENNESASMNF